MVADGTIHYVLQGYFFLLNLLICIELMMVKAIINCVDKAYLLQIVEKIVNELTIEKVLL